MTQWYNPFTIKFIDIFIYIYHIWHMLSKFVVEKLEERRLDISLVDTSSIESLKRKADKK